VRAFEFDVWRCAHCGLLFCNPYPSPAQLEHYYQSDMKAFENAFFLESFENRVRLFAPRVEILTRIKPAGSLLDVGSAIGIFIEAVRRSGAGYALTCCDLSAEVCAGLRQRFPGIEVIQSNVLDLNDARRYDVVTLWDTIEHVVDLDGLMEVLGRILADDGILVFSTPNTASFEWRIAGERHVQILPPGHVNLMNPTCIGILLERHGFAVREAHTLNASLDITYVDKLIADGTADITRLGTFLRDELSDPDFRAMLERYLIDKRRAGNIVVVAERAGRSAAA